MKGNNRVRCGGFTLVELLVTLAVAAIVMTAAVPSFTSLIRDNRLATQTNRFTRTLNLARSEAVKRGARVTICKSANGQSCAATGGWEQGWIVFVDADDDAAVDAGETILLVQEALVGATLAGDANVASYISYTGDGTTRLTSNAFQAGTVTLCDAPQGTDIVINATGRPRISGVACGT